MLASDKRLLGLVLAAILLAFVGWMIIQGQKAVPSSNPVSALPTPAPVESELMVTDTTAEQPSAQEANDPLFVDMAVELDEDTFSDDFMSDEDFEDITFDDIEL